MFSDLQAMMMVFESDTQEVLPSEKKSTPGWKGSWNTRLAVHRPLLLPHCALIWKAFRTWWVHLLLLIKDFCILEETGLSRHHFIIQTPKCLYKSHPHEKEGNTKGISVKLHHMEPLVLSLILPLHTHPSTHLLPFLIPGESQEPSWGLYLTTANLG